MDVERRQEEDHVKDNSGDESDASHASMPELIPVSPPASPGPSAEPVRSPPESSLRSSRGAKRRALAARQRVDTESSGEKARGLVPELCGTAASGSSSQPSKKRMLNEEDVDSLGNVALKASTASFAPDDGVASSFRLAGVGGVGFGSKVDALAEALDCVGPPATSLAAAAEAGAEDVPEPLLRKEDVDNFGVEVSAASEKRLRMGRDESDEILDEDMDADSSGDELEPGAKRRKLFISERPAMEVPPGAPAAAPAALAVAAAAGTFPSECFDDALEPMSAKSTVTTPEEPLADKGKTGSAGSFGPRFQALPAAEIANAQKQWQLHSLMDVQATSAAQNRRTAAELFDSLRKRRAAKEGADASGAEDHHVSQDQGGAVGKPTFRRPVATAGPAKSSSIEGSSLAAGGQLMAPCIAGAGPSRPGVTVTLRPGVTILTRSAAPHRAATGQRSVVTCADVEEADDGQEEAVPLPCISASGPQARKAAQAARRVACSAGMEEGNDKI